MNGFNRMTIVAAAEVVAAFKSHADMHVLEVEWGIDGRYPATSKSARASGLAKIAIEEQLEVMTEAGRVKLARALIETAIRAPVIEHSFPSWRKLVAGLRFDGFEIVEVQSEAASEYAWQDAPPNAAAQLVRMLPSDLPDLDFREAESEVELLLGRHSLTVAQGHLRQAVAAFSRGEWSSANGELRNFIESYLNEIAVALGFTGDGDSKVKRDFLGRLEPPFLLTDYNEWNINSKKPQYVQGLMSRMHLHGAHPGLSDEEDATFRLQISLVTARLFLRRFDRRHVG